MPAHKKTEADWNRIHDRWVSEYIQGQVSLRRLAKEEGVSHPAIIERAKRYNWSDNGNDQGLPATAPVYKPPYDITDTMPVKGSAKDCPARRAQILVDLSKGEPRGVACAKAGITTQTLREWAKSDPDFSAEILRAEATLPTKAVKAINDDIERGNSALGLKILERHPLSKDEWGSAEAGGLTINLNIPTPGTVSAPTIDVTPQD